MPSTTTRRTSRRFRKVSDEGSTLRETTVLKSVEAAFGGAGAAPFAAARAVPGCASIAAEAISSTDFQFERIGCTPGLIYFDCATCPLTGTGTNAFTTSPEIGRASWRERV